jgi:hypothetical protein
MRATRNDCLSVLIHEPSHASFGARRSGLLVQARVEGITPAIGAIPLPCTVASRHRPERVKDQRVRKEHRATRIAVAPSAGRSSGDAGAKNPAASGKILPAAPTMADVAVPRPPTNPSRRHQEQSTSGGTALALRTGQTHYKPIDGHTPHAICTRARDMREGESQ